MATSSISVQSQLFQRLRSNDRTLRCLRIHTESTPTGTLLCEALINNSSVNQVIVTGSGVTTPTTVARVPVWSVDAAAEFLAALHHLPLKVLNLSNVGLTDEHMDHVMALVKASKTIQRLDLSRNRISSSVAERLGSIIAAHVSLTTLDVSVCQLGDTGVSSLLMPIINAAAASVEGGGGGAVVSKLERVDLAHNLLSETSVLVLARAAAQQKSLTHLSLKGNFLLASEISDKIQPLLTKNADAAKAKKSRPSSALGFLSTLDVNVSPTANQAAAANKKGGASPVAGGSAPLPSLDILSKHLEDEFHEETASNSR